METSLESAKAHVERIRGLVKQLNVAMMDAQMDGVTTDIKVEPWAHVDISTITQGPAPVRAIPTRIFCEPKLLL